MLKVQDLRVMYRSEQGVVEAVRGVSFAVQRGEFYTLLGPSGCGKTSTLRAIAGLETPFGGTIEIGSTVVFSAAAGTAIPVYQRGIGMVFQSYAIWPHMSVFDNVAFPLIHGARRYPRAVVREKVMQALSLVQLEELASRPSPLLSGGQQQRVALARALVYEPAVLLLDEPLSNLDAKLREEMRQELKALLRRLGITALYVTHDQLEALSMSDTVALMHDGVIEQAGPPRRMYLEPLTPFAANFLGRTNMLEGRVQDSAGSGDSQGTVETEWGLLVCPLPPELGPGARVTVGFRPESVKLSAEQPEAGRNVNVLRGIVASQSFAGDTVEYWVDLGDRQIRAKGGPFELFVEGDSVYARIPPRRCFVIGAGEREPALAGATR